MLGMKNDPTVDVKNAKKWCSLFGHSWNK